MIDHLIQLAKSVEGSIPRRNLAREYLQARILEALQRAGAFSAWAFCGGTSLRFLFLLPRFSEDLDFALHGEYPPGGFRSALESVKRGLSKENYPVEIKVSDRRIVHAAFVDFPGLPRMVGASDHPRESLSIKIELDTRPPPGAKTALTLVRRHIMLNLTHYDRSSLLAGKLHALLSRPYLKGRDLFDLVWYLSDGTWPAPNLDLLCSALEQTGWAGKRPTSRTWKGLIRNRLEDADWNLARRDVEPFLERPQDLAWVSPEHLLPLLK